MAMNGRAGVGGWAVGLLSLCAPETLYTLTGLWAAWGDSQLFPATHPGPFPTHTYLASSMGTY